MPYTLSLLCINIFSKRVKIGAKMTANYAIYYHIILTIKYRKKIIDRYDQDIKAIIQEVANTSNFSIEKMEGDKYHLHILVSSRPDISPSQIVKRIKQQTTYTLWQKYPIELKKEFWKHHVFWNPSYYLASIGSVSREAIERYISDQGK
jgi:putative transposase